MKFLCEHCKAKYQIADETVAGRTVRMKCRKCGNSIEVRAAVTETSVNTRPPAEAPSTAYTTAPPGAPPKPPRPPPARPLATSFSSAQKPPPARTTGAPRSSSDQGSLAGAFQRNVQTKEDEISVALDLRELSAADEWYVAINGVPVGPVRVAELRRKATIGVVTEESLCWQEGMEEWRPVRAVAELAALVREAAASGRVSLVTPPPPEVHLASGSPSSKPGSMRPAASAVARPAKPAPMPGPAPRSNVVPFTARLATAEKLHEEPKAAPPFSTMIASDPFASSAASPLFPLSPPIAATSAVAPPAAPTAAMPMTGAPGLEAPAVATQVAATPSLFPAELIPRKAPPWILIAMFVLAAAFGITAAVLVFKPATQVVVQIPSAAPPAAMPSGVASSAASSPFPTETSATPANVGGPAKVASGPRAGSGAASVKPNATVATDPALRDLIAGAGGGAGPSANAGESAGSGGGAQLTEDQVRGVLAAHTAGVKRTCWERMQTQSSSVNVTVHIVAGNSGQVTSATATGNDPLVAHCIEAEVRRWTFPGSGAIDIPFHFLRQ